MKNEREIIFDGNDTISSVIDMLWLVEKNISEIEQKGEDVSIKGSSAVIFCVVDNLKSLQKEFTEILKGGR